MTARLLIGLLAAGIPLAGFIAWGVFASWWLGRDYRPRPAPIPAGCLVSPAPFPSASIPDCPAIAGRIADRAWLDFVAAHDLGGAR